MRIALSNLCMILGLFMLFGATLYAMFTGVEVLAWAGGDGSISAAVDYFNTFALTGIGGSLFVVVGYKLEPRCY